MIPGVTHHLHNYIIDLELTFELHICMTLIIHKMLRKKGQTTQHSRRQSNITQLAQAGILKRKLPLVGFEPMTVCLLGDGHSYQLSY